MPDSLTDSARVRYIDGSKSIAITLLHTWNRGEVVPISGSSGLKEYIKNDVWSLFEANLGVDRIVMVRGNGPTFFLMRNRGCWFDATGKQVVGEEKQP